MSLSSELPSSHLPLVPLFPELDNLKTHPQHKEEEEACAHQLIVPQPVALPTPVSQRIEKKIKIVPASDSINHMRTKNLQEQFPLVSQKRIKRGQPFTQAYCDKRTEKWQKKLSERQKKAEELKQQAIDARQLQRQLQHEQQRQERQQQQFFRPKSDAAFLEKRAEIWQKIGEERLQQANAKEQHLQRQQYQDQQRINNFRNKFSLNGIPI